MLISLVLWYILIRGANSLLYKTPGLSVAWKEVLNNAWLKIVVYGILPLPFLFKWTSSCSNILKAVYFILSPLVLFMVIIPLQYKIWNPIEKDALELAIERANQDSKISSSNNIYIIFMDAWSYNRTFTNEVPWHEMKELTEFVSGATVYHNAYSPGNGTFSSFPRFIFQPDNEFKNLNFNKLYHVVVAREAVQAKSIFDNVPDNWFTVMIGNLHDYESMLYRRIDYAVRYDDPAMPFLATVKMMLKTQLNWVRFVGIKLSFKAEAFKNVLWGLRVEPIRNDGLKLISEVDVPIFAVLHYDIPHHPFIWDRYGQKDETRWASDPLAPSIPGYMDNLKRTDFIIGELVDKLKSVGKYDQSLIIFTSDHAWREDPDQSVPIENNIDTISEIRHVPLIIKFPGQQVRLDRDEFIQTSDIYPFIEPILTDTETEKSVR